MPQTGLEDAVAETLLTSRDILSVSRARCYAMDPSGSFRLAASYGFGSRFGPEDVLEAGHPLIDWVQRHRRPTFVNSPRDAGALGPLMEREHYAHSLTAPLYQGSRLVSSSCRTRRTDLPSPRRMCDRSNRSQARSRRSSVSSMARKWQPPSPCRRKTAKRFSCPRGRERNFRIPRIFFPAPKKSSGPSRRPWRRLPPWRGMARRN